MEETKQPSNNHQRKIFVAIVFGISAVIALIVLYFYVQYKKTHIATDDAFVDGHVHTVASKVSGTVKAVYVNDNQLVKAGDVLVEVDPVDYDVKVDEAASGLDAEKAKLTEMNARVESAKKQFSERRAAAEAARASVELQEANLRQAELDIKRAEALYKKEVVSKERFEKTTTAYDVALAQVKAAQEGLKEAEKAVETQQAAVKQAEAAGTSQVAFIREKEALLRTARLNYGYTKIPAPSEGYVTKKSVEVGNQIQAGQPLMAVVPLNDIWITANYKETQLEKVSPGQNVEIKVDTYPGEKLKGTVDSIMSGSGAVFSLFPPENATGNFVKVVQRVPVKIVLNKDADRQHILRVGMSVEPTVIIETQSSPGGGRKTGAERKD
ncbi:MAG: HlyD family secretion protein [Thermodesulfovibrionales bacterium]|jgi:membrane fusion protein (multidrug efflux system)